MDKTKLVSFTLGDFDVNSYLLFNEDNKESIIIDAPFGVEKVLSFIDDKGFNLSGIIITHGHGDHIHGLIGIDAPFYIHKSDAEFLCEPDLNLSSLMGAPFKIKQKPYILEEGIFRIGSFKILVIHTPGHSPGSVSLSFPKRLFCGDTLFYNAIGRTDLPRASYSELISSINNKIMVLGDDTTVFPGHGISTTIKRERDNNPFLKQ